jgi:hypothetical protein
MKFCVREKVPSSEFMRHDSAFRIELQKTTTRNSVAERSNRARV